MAPWIVCLLCAVVILKPQEFIPLLSGVPLVHLLFGAAMLACLVDVVRGRIRATPAPQTPYVAAFLAWALLTTALKKPDALEQEALGAGIVGCVFLVSSAGLSS